MCSDYYKYADFSSLLVSCTFLSPSPPLDVTQIIRGHKSKQALLPPFHYGTLLLLIANITQHLLPSSTRISLRWSPVFIVFVVFDNTAENMAGAGHPGKGVCGMLNFVG